MCGTLNEPAHEEGAAYVGRPRRVAFLTAFGEGHSYYDGVEMHVSLSDTRFC